MFSWNIISPKGARYQPLTAGEEEWTDSSTSGEHRKLYTASQEQTLSRSPWLHLRNQIAIFLSILAVGGICGIAAYVVMRYLSIQHAQSLSDEHLTSTAPLDDTLTQPDCSRRHEWRTLSPESQQKYITAVHCLLDRPSKFSGRLNVDGISAYSDFPYVHAHVGYRTHNSAPFLPWHRYLLHTYEVALREHCGYTGGLVYWDWTLDVDDLSRSPVLDAQTGFGGNGDPNGKITVGQHGRCLQEGPFQDVQALWYDVKYEPHCLSRGFRNDNGSGKIDTSQITLEKIDDIMKLDDYEQFVRRLESQVHDAIPFGIGGDFETFSAPFDPLFYLHHVQLDRLWWLWQQSDSKSRLFAYGGHNGRHTIEAATLTDGISLGGLAPAIEVQDIMDTGGNNTMLCYTY